MINSVPIIDKKQFLSAPGPYSSVINWDEEAKREEERNKQLQGEQQKIMRTNAIGDAFRLLFEGFGGSKGATITNRGPNPYLTKASERYYALQDQGEGIRRNYRLQDLASREKMNEMNTNYKVGKADQAENRRYNETQKQEDRAWTEKQQDKAFTQHEEMAELNLQKQYALQRNSTNENIREYQAKKNIADNEMNRILSTPRTEAATDTDVPFIIPGTRQTIFLREHEIQEMLYRLTKDKQKYDPQLEEALQALLKNDPVRKESSLQVLKKNWDIIKDVLPEFAGQEVTETALPPTQLQQRMTAYDSELQAIESSDKRDGWKERQRKKLDKEFKDVLQYRLRETEQTAEPVDGKTDVSGYFN